MFPAWTFFPLGFSHVILVGIGILKPNLDPGSACCCGVLTVSQPSLWWAELGDIHPYHELTGPLTSQAGHVL